MKKLTCLIIACILLGFRSHAEPVSTHEPGYRLSIELRDGSRVIGQTTDDILSFHSATLGDMKLSWAGIHAVEYAADTDTARLTATNGDAFTVQLSTDTVHLETSFGKIDLPVKLLRSIKVLPAAILNASGGSAAMNGSSSRLTIELRDGSHVVGKSLDDTLNFHSPAMGDLKLTWAGIRSIEYTADTDIARLTETNNDVYEVRFADPTVRLETSFGKTELPVKLIRSITVSQTGKLGQLPTGLVALWSGDGDGNDSVGGHDATVPPGITYAPGKVGQGFAFDGQEHRILVPSAPELNFGDNQDFSITTWIEPQPSNTSFGVMSIVDKRFLDPSDSPSPGYEISLQDGRIHTRIMNTPFGPAGPDMRDGQFHLVALTVQRNSPAGGHLFVDGYPVLTFDTTSLRGDLSNDQPLHIGCNCFPNFNGFFKGIINQVALYNRALSALEIQTIYKDANNGELPRSPVSPKLPEAIE